MKRVLQLILPVLLFSFAVSSACAKDEDGGSGGGGVIRDIDGDGDRGYPYGPDFDDDNDGALQGILGGHDIDDRAAGVQQALNIGTFTLGTNLGVGDGPRGVDAGDFNNDGNIDIITADQNSSSVSLLLGDGSGGLGTATPIALSDEGYFVVAADMNGDGNLDIVAGGAAGLTVLLGNGDGTFGGMLIDTSINGWVPWIAVADFDADGVLDVALVDAGGASNSVRVLSGDGDGTFTQSDNHVFTSTVGGLAIGDVDGNGSLDIVGFGNLTTAPGEYGVMISNGDGTFVAPVLTTVAVYAKWGFLAYLDNDSIPDLMIGSPITSGVLVALGQGGGVFGTPVLVGGIATTNFIRTADINNDGNLDMVVASQTTGLSIALGSATGAFSAFTGTDVGTGENGLVVCDLNGDRKWDIVVANISSNDIAILMGD